MSPSRCSAYVATTLLAARSHVQISLTRRLKERYSHVLSLPPRIIDTIFLFHW